MARQPQPSPPPRRHSHHSVKLHEADILRVQNQVLETKVVELTEELVKTQYELKLERVNYRHLHRKTLGLEVQLENQVHLVMELEQRLTDTTAQLELFRKHELDTQVPTTDLTAACTEHLKMLHEDLDMYDARCAMYEAGIRELWSTYVTPPTPELTKGDSTPSKPVKASATDKKCERSDVDSDDTASMDSDSSDRELQASDEVLEMAFHRVDELCVALADSVVMHQEHLAAISALESQLEMDRLQYEEGQRLVDTGSANRDDDSSLGHIDLMYLTELLVYLDR